MGWWQHHRLEVHATLPLFDGVFAVALTLLAFSVPERLGTMGDVTSLYSAILAYGLNGIAILLYWYKLRRLVVLTRALHLQQLLLGLLGLLTVVVLPKFSALALEHGHGQGDLTNWTLAQVSNVSFLGALFLFDGLCLLYAISLLRHGAVRRSDRQHVRAAVRSQAFGFVVLLVMAMMELLLSWFNNEYVLLVPLVLLVEEFLIARRIG
jgi:uncharacterized membrane protein